jgi:DNA polymerase III subunit beta
MQDFDRARLAAAVAFASRALPRSPAIPVLTGLRVTGANGQATVSAFDFDTYAEANAGPASEDFDVLLPGRAFASYLSGMTCGQVTLTVGERQAEISGGSARVTLPLLSLADYPTAPHIPESIGVIDAGAFTAAFASVAEAVDPNFATANLRGVVFDLNDGALTLAGVHSQRCAIRTVHDWTATGTAKVIAPLVLADAAKLMDGPLAVAITEQVVCLFDDARCVLTRILDGQSPDYMRTFDVFAGDLTVTCDREDLIAALRWIGSGDTRKDMAGVLRMTIEPDGLTVALSGAEAMTASTSIEAKVDGDGIDVGWKAENLLAGLTGTTAATVTLRFSTPTKPCLLTAESDPGYRYLGMPIRLSEAR